MQKVILKKQAFISLALSAIEVYKKESFGFLIGKKRGKDYYVENAVSYQSTKRDYDYVTLDLKRQNKLNVVLNFMSRDSFLGDFHSHPDFPDYLSKHDKTEILEGKEGYLAMLVLIKKSKKFQEWKTTSKYAISGTIGKNYYLKIRGYIVENEKIVPIKVKCDYIHKLNEYIKRYNKISKQLEKINKETKNYKTVKSKIKKELNTYFGV